MYKFTYQGYFMKFLFFEEFFFQLVNYFLNHGLYQFQLSRRLTKSKLICCRTKKYFFIHLGKSNFSLKSKSSINSNFSRKRNKRSKKSRKVSAITPEECSIDDNKSGSNSQKNKQFVKTSNVKLREIHKKLQV
jgi:hypothetical protein